MCSGDDGTGIDDRITTAYARGRLLKFSFGSNTRRHDITLKCTLHCIQSTTLITSMHAPHMHTLYCCPQIKREVIFFLCLNVEHFMLTYMFIDLKMFFFCSFTPQGIIKVIHFKIYTEIVVIKFIPFYCQK